MLIDTHTHLYLDDFAPENLEVVKRAIDAGVDAMIFPNVDCSTVKPMFDLHDQMPDRLHMAMGLHPTEINDGWRDAIAEIKSYVDSDRTFVAIGEIGIDLYWDATYRDEQMLALEMQIGWAVERALPVILHCRDGLSETLEVLEGFRGKAKGVFHSFGGTVSDVEAIRRRVGDFYFGINGVVTFKNSRLREVLPSIGADRLLLETDSPYLTPVPYRGKRNESAYLPYVCACVAGALGVDEKQAADMTTANARRLFAI